MYYAGHKGTGNFTNNSALTSLIGLNSLTATGQGLSINGNGLLKNLTGLSNYVVAETELDISNNNSLNSLNELCNLASIGDKLKITNNPQLALCSIQPFCQFLQNYVQNSSGLLVDISNNATGCESYTTILANCGTPLKLQPEPSQILSFLADESGCPVRLVGESTGTAFVFTGPNNYVFSYIYRNAKTYAPVSIDVKQPGVYVLTATSTNACGSSEPVTQTVTVSRSCP